MMRTATIATIPMNAPRTAAMITPLEEFSAIGTALFRGAVVVVVVVGVVTMKVGTVVGVVSGELKVLIVPGSVVVVVVLEVVVVVAAAAVVVVVGKAVFEVTALVAREQQHQGSKSPLRSSHRSLWRRWEPRLIEPVRWVQAQRFGPAHALVPAADWLAWRNQDRLDSSAVGSTRPRSATSDWAALSGRLRWQQESESICQAAPPW
eukprot:m.871283 g.871283  ORF g.871283 m.871283 type:complete len:206 (-) comp59761_c1_seq6:441-1058(-)